MAPKKVVEVVPAASRTINLLRDIGYELPQAVADLVAERPHEALSDLTPMAAEELHYAAKNDLAPTG